MFACAAVDLTRNQLNLFENLIIMESSQVSSLPTVFIYVDTDQVIFQIFICILCILYFVEKLKEMQRLQAV